MATKIQIICTRPGMRRMGVEHPTTKTYNPGEWTEEQLIAFRADPAFVVQEIDENAVVTRGLEFDRAVADEVSKQVSEKYMSMQLSFNTAVSDAAAEKIKQAVDEVNAATTSQIEAAVNIAIGEVNMQLASKINALETENATLKAAAAKAPAKK